MHLIAQGQDQGWSATQWLALLAVLGSLAGVWLGKTLEARNQRKLQKVEEAREEARALQEALIQTELLYLRLDPETLIGQARQGLSVSDVEAAKVADTLRKHSDHVQDLLVRAGIQSSSETVRPVLPALERSLNRAVQELLLFLAISFNDKNQEAHTGKSARHIQIRLEETQSLIRLFREALGLNPNFLAEPLPIETSPRSEGTGSKQAGPVDAIWPVDKVSGIRESLRGREELRAGQVTPCDGKGQQQKPLPLTPNLLDLSPPEFEALVAYLLTNMGFEFEHSASKDSGVDGIATNLSSGFGGKLLVQAKRYRRPVPVDSVRSFYGEVLHQGAAQGILITTSTFTRSAHSFAINKPLELIDGANLIFLLSEYAGIEASISTEPG
jgi:hypothetical protein